MVSNFRDILAQDVVNSCDGVSPSEVIVHNLKIDFAMNQQVRGWSCWDECNKSAGEGLVRLFALVSAYPILLFCH